MSKKQHEKQLARARAKRQAEKQHARRRNRGLAIVGGVILLVALLVGGNAWLDRGDDAEPTAGATDGTAAASPEATASAGATTTPADGDATTAPSEPVVGGTEGLCPPPDDAPEPDLDLQWDEAPPADDVPETVEAVITTTCGDITVQLDGAAAPGTVANFLFLAQEGYYVGTPFHRVMADFVIQGGDPTGTGTGGPGYSIADELGPIEEFESDPGPCDQDPEVACFRYPRGTLAMANAGPDTAGSQFFIVQAEPYLVWPAAYTPFGEVTDGMDVVDDIANGPVTGQFGDQAVDPAVVLDIEVTAPASE
jgi:peptidyl-prolyl cis-trans isomerase B (cyclophilin B)